MSFVLFLNVLLQAQNIRQPKDTVGFAWTSVDMDRLIGYLNKNGGAAGNISERLIAGLSPHDDYLYAGKVYFPLFKNIQAKEFVIIGLTHGSVRKAVNDPKDIIILDNFQSWKGIYSNVRIAPLREIIKKRLNEKYYTVNDEAHKLEHSIEALIPFIQYYNREIKITPIMITAMSSDRMEQITNDLSRIISDYIDQNSLRLGSDIFFLISSDANHYGKDFNNALYGEDKNAHTLATGNDKRFADACINTVINSSSVKTLTDELWNNIPTPVWCGRYSIPFGLLTVSKVVKQVSGKELMGKVIKYSDTVTEGVLPVKNTKMGLTAQANFEHWCGFLSAGFYLK